MSDDLKRAKEKAADYSTAAAPGPKKTDDNPATKPPGEAQQPRKETWDLDQWESFADQRIEEAMRAGAFDNLPGRGKPLASDDEPFEPSELRMANKLLRNNDLTPGWIGDRGSLVTRIEQFRAEVAAEARRHRTAWQQAGNDSAREEIRASWRYCVDAWTAEIDELNRKILTVNLQLPTMRLELYQLRLGEELARVGMETEIG